jgi:hypothetical protein
LPREIGAFLFLFVFCSQRFCELDDSFLLRPVSPAVSFSGEFLRPCARDDSFLLRPVS